MSKLDIAAQRFEKALKAVESAAGPVSRMRVEAAAAAKKAVELAAERERLLARVAELEEENRALSGFTEEVEERLDGAIGQIRAALGR